MDHRLTMQEGDLVFASAEAATAYRARKWRRAPQIDFPLLVAGDHKNNGVHSTSEAASSVAIIMKMRKTSR